MTARGKKRLQLIVKLIEGADTMPEREWYIELYKKYRDPADEAVLMMRDFYNRKERTVTRVIGIACPVCGKPALPDRGHCSDACFAVSQITG